MNQKVSDFKERFEEALQKLDVRPIDISRKTGISEATLSQYRSGYSQPREKRLIQIATVLGVDPAWLMGLDVPMVRYSADFDFADARTAQLTAILSSLSDIGTEKLFQYAADLEKLYPREGDDHAETQA